jgi:Zn-dependent alcohol dehydrogenase
MKIRAAVVRSTGAAAPFATSRPVQIDEVELDEPGHGEVLVRIRAAGLCHSDLSVINGDRPRAMPIALGHEASAEVLRCGPGVDDLAAGDHVVLVFVPSCGCCLPCMEGRPALCEPGAKANAAGTLLGGGRRLHLADGGQLNHHTGVSCFADHAVVSRRSCVKIAPGLSHREAALFGCAVLTGAGAVLNSARLQAGQTVAVVGLGGVGLSALLAAVAAGARAVVAVDLNDDKLALARRLGATLAVNAADPDVVAQVQAHTAVGAAAGVDFGLEMAGSVKAFELAFAITRRGGSTITSGLPNPASRFGLSLSQLVAEERSVRGSYLGSGVPARDIPNLIALYRQGKLPVDQLMGEVWTLDTINEGFDHLASGAGLRDVVLMD